MPAAKSARAAGAKKWSPLVTSLVTKEAKKMANEIAAADSTTVRSTIDDCAAKPQAHILPVS